MYSSQPSTIINVLTILFHLPHLSFLISQSSSNSLKLEVRSKYLFSNNFPKASKLRERGRSPGLFSSSHSLHNLLLPTPFHNFLPLSALARGPPCCGWKNAACSHLRDLHLLFTLLKTLSLLPLPTPYTKFLQKCNF